MPASNEIPPETSGEADTVPSFAEFLDALNDGDEEPPAYKTDVDAGTTFRFIYDGWVKRGSYERGKARHSVRQIRDWLGKEENQIRSLETKLAGKTRLRYHEAIVLFGLFILHWNYDKENSQYLPYYKGDIDQLAKTFAQELFPGDRKTLLLPARTRANENGASYSTSTIEPEDSELEGTLPADETIKKLFAQSDVLITISRARTIIGSDQPTAMKEFHDVLEDLYTIDQQDGRNRILIWIIDFGLREDLLSARRAIYNFYFLVAQFRSIALIEKAGRDEFYTWLNKNVCFIVGSLKKDEIERFYKDAKLELPAPPIDHFWFQSDRLFLESIPGRWLDAPGSEAYGKPQKELWDSPTITAHLKLDDWDLDHMPDVDVQKNLRYFFHGEIKQNTNTANDAAVRCIPLPEPGMRWSNAYRLAVQAALGRLKRSRDERISTTDAHEALATLATQHFAALRLREFVGLARTLVDDAYDSLKSS